MQTAKRALLGGLAAIALATACDGGSGEVTADPGGAAEGGAVAKGVELRIPGSGGGIGISADALALRGDGTVILEGNVRAAFAVGPDAGAFR